MTAASGRSNPDGERGGRKNGTEGARDLVGESLHQNGSSRGLPAAGATGRQKIHPPVRQQTGPVTQQTFPGPIRRERLCQRSTAVSS